MSKRKDQTKPLDPSRDERMGGVLRALLTVPKKKLDDALAKEKREKPPRSPLDDDG